MAGICRISRLISSVARGPKSISFASNTSNQTSMIVKSQLQRTFSSSAVCCSTNPLKNWKLGKLNHLAVVTPDLDKSSNFYESMLGAEVSDKQPLPEHGVTVVFVKLPGDTKIELLHPLGENSPIQSFLNKNKNGGMHHICIEVEDLEAAIKDLRSNNIRPLSENSKIGAHGKPVIFLHPKDCNGVLVELEQS